MRFPRWATIALIVASIAAPGVPAGAQDLSGPGPWVVRAWFGDDAMVREVASWGEHFSDYHASKGYIVVEADAEILGRLRTLGFFVELDEAGTRTLRLGQEAIAAGRTLLGIPGFPCYRTVEETFAAAQALAAAYPSFATVIDSGDSWEKVTAGGLPGYDMLVLKLTNSAVPGPKPVFFNTAAIHAREYVTAETAIRFAEQLLAGYGTDADANWLLDHREYHLMLHANPDGRKHAENQEDWRKNTNEAYCGATSASRGADLNRNFDFYWGLWPGSSTNPCSTTFRGATAASEPETQAIQAYMAAVLTDQRDPDDLTALAPDDTTGVYVDLHSYNPAILGPWGLMGDRQLCTGADLTPNCAQILRLGRKLGHLSAWDPRAGGLYETNGATKDHAYGRYGVPAYTWEMGTFPFFLACADFEEAVVGPGLEMLRYTLRVARAPYMEPLGPDAYRAELLPGAVEAGTTVSLTAQANDARYFDEDATEPTGTIAEARAFVDLPPWSPGATPVALAAADGAFDEASEALEGTLDTTGLAEGVHTVYVHARDAAGNWGPAAGGLLAIVDPATDPLIEGTVLAAGTLAPLAARVRVGPFATATDPGTGAYALRVPAGTYDVVARAELHAPRTAAGVVAAPSSTVTEDFLLPPPIFADDGEAGGTPGWTPQAPWALRTDVAYSGIHSWSDSAANYGNNINLALTSPVIDLSDASDVELVFRHLYMIEGSYDYGWVEISTNGGSSWTLAKRFSGAVSWDWENVSVPLPALDGVQNARFRFRITSDGGLVRDGWHLDDIALAGVLPPAAPQSLGVVVAGPGSVASSPPGIACPSDCSESYPAGTPVELTATPGPDAYFAGWSGDCTGTGACNLTMSAPRAVTATFDTMPFLDGFASGDTSAWSTTVP